MGSLSPRLHLLNFLRVMNDRVEHAATAVAAADAIVVTAGAGMGVDSGLPDFRGREGFWRAYPALAKRGLEFEQMATPAWFDQDPELAWGFYGHRLNLYRDTVPHSGFATLLHWIQSKPAGGFVITSNVDGHFQRAGFASQSILECHGSIHYFQCMRECRGVLWEAPAGLRLSVNESTCRANSPLPRCPHCGGLARPNILMFSDVGWQPARTDEQDRAFERWLAERTAARLVVIELGAGTAVATIRHQSETLQRAGATLVRINPREAHGPPGTISLASGARDAIDAIARCLATA